MPSTANYRLPKTLAVSPWRASNATGSSNGYVFSTFIAGGYDFHIGQLTIGPTAALQYSSEEINGFSENGSIAPVKVNSDTQDSWPASSLRINKPSEYTILNIARFAIMASLMGRFPSLLNCQRHR